MVTLIENDNVKDFLSGYWQDSVPNIDGYYLVKNRNTDIIEKDLKYVKNGRYKTPYNYLWWSVSFPYNNFSKVGARSAVDDKKGKIGDGFSYRCKSDGSIDYNYYCGLPFDDKPGYISKCKARDINDSMISGYVFITIDFPLGFTPKSKAFAFMLEGQKMCLPSYSVLWRGYSKRGNGYRFLVDRYLVRDKGLI